MHISSFSLNFLLHMGLGKTLQSLCIIAGDHYHRAQDYKVHNVYLA